MSSTSAMLRVDLPRQRLHRDVRDGEEEPGEAEQDPGTRANSLVAAAEDEHGADRGEQRLEHEHRGDRIVGALSGAGLACEREQREARRSDRSQPHCLRFSSKPKKRSATTPSTTSPPASTACTSDSAANVSAPHVEDVGDDRERVADRPPPGPKQRDRRAPRVANVDVRRGHGSAVAKQKADLCHERRQAGQQEPQEERHLYAPSRGPAAATRLWSYSSQACTLSWFASTRRRSPWRPAPGPRS